MSEITRDDIISKDALEAPLILADNLDKAVKKFKEFRDSAVKTNEATQNTKSTKEATDAVEKLAAEQAELIKINNQLVTVQAKNNEAYAEAKRKLDDANASLKNRIKLGEEDSTTVTRQNSSITKLQAALTKNKQAYAALTTEQQRSGKEGRNLLKVIQQQDKDFKELSASMGQHQANVGNYQSALEGLDGAAGGVISRLKGLGQQFLALLSNPVVAVLAGIAATFLILKNAAETYYKTTLEGEQDLQRQILENDAFWSAYQDRWAHIGKEASSTWEDLKNAWKSVVQFFSSDELAKSAEERAKKATAASNALAATQKEHIRDVVDDAKTELEVAELLEVSKNKLKYSDEQRLAALRKANQLIQEQAQGDVELAEQDLKNERDRLEAIGKRMKGWKSLSDLNDQQIEATKLTGEELKKLAELEAAVQKVREGAAMKQKANNKAEFALVKEIHDDKIALLKDEVAETVAAKQAELNAKIKAIQDEVIAGKEVKPEGDKRIANLRKAFADDLIQANIDGLNKMLISEELTAEERAKIEKELTQLKIDLNTAVYDQLVYLDEVTIKADEERVKKTEDTLLEIYNLYVNFADSVAGIFDGLTQRRIQNLDAEIEKLNEKTDTEVKNAGDNDAAVAAIEANAEVRREQLERKKTEAMRKQAILEKSLSLVRLAIQTAIDIAKIKSALAAANTAALVYGPLLSPPIIAANSAAAATQIALAYLGSSLAAAAIAAQPIPQFAVGTDNAPEGLAIVGEKGPELKIEPSGKTSLTPGVPTLDYLKAGTKIIPYKETMRIMALSGLGEEALKAREQSQQVDLARSLNQIEKNTRKLGKPAPTGNLFKQGSLTYEQIQRENGNRKNIRRTNLGY